MKLKMFRDAALVKLKRDIEKNIDKYSTSTTSWIEDYFKENEIEEYLVDTNIEINNFTLINGDQNTDAENAKRVYEAMKNLLPIHAREEKIWAYLTHSLGYEYMQKRWGLSNVKNPGSRISSRYFFQGKTTNVIATTTVPYVRNGLARLWWAGYIVYDDSNDNHYEYIDELFVSQDLFVGLCERDIAKNKSVVTSILKCVRKYDIKNKNNNTSLVRNILKQINLQAGLIVLDALDDEEIYNFVDNIFKSFIENE